MSYGGTEARVGTWLAAREPSQDRGVEGVVEALQPFHEDGGPALRAERVERDPIAQVVESDGQGERSLALMLEHRSTNGGGLGARSGDVQQHEYPEVTPGSHHVEIDRFIRHRAGERLHVRLDRGVQIDVDALQLTVAPLEGDAEMRKGSANGEHVRHRERDVGGRGVDGHHVAPLWAVPALVHVPLRIGRSSRDRPITLRGDGCADRGRRGDPRGLSATPAPVGGGLSAGRSARGGSRPAEEILEQVPEGATASDGTRQQVGAGQGLVFVVVELAQEVSTLRPRVVGARLGGGHVAAPRRSPDRSGSDDAELLWREGKWSATRGDLQRLRRRRALGCELAVDQSARRDGEQIFEVRERPVSFDRQITTGQIAVPGHPAE